MKETIDSFLASLREEVLSCFYFETTVTFTNVIHWPRRLEVWFMVFCLGQKHFQSFTILFLDDLEEEIHSIFKRLIREDIINVINSILKESFSFEDSPFDFFLLAPFTAENLINIIWVGSIVNKLFLLFTLFFDWTDIGGRVLFVLSSWRPASSSFCFVLFCDCQWFRKFDFIFASFWPTFAPLACKGQVFICFFLHQGGGYLRLVFAPLRPALASLDLATEGEVQLLNMEGLVQITSFYLLLF